MSTVCTLCDCYTDWPCRCARGCTNHSTTVTVPSRVRNVFAACMENPNHGRGEVGETLLAKLHDSSPRTRVELTAAERRLLIEEAHTLFVVTADDASWDNDAKNDRQAARVCLRKLGVEP